MTAEHRGQGLGPCLPCLQLVLVHGKGLGAKIGDANSLERWRVFLVTMATSAKIDKQNPILKNSLSSFCFLEGQEVSNDITGRHSIDRGPSTAPRRNDRLRMRPPWPPEHGPQVQGRPVPRFGPDGQELQDLEPQPGAISPGLVADESMWDYCGIGWGVYPQHDYNKT